jgi:hypothetical protein
LSERGEAGLPCACSEIKVPEAMGMRPGARPVSRCPAILEQLSLLYFHLLPHFILGGHLPPSLGQLQGREATWGTDLQLGSRVGWKTPISAWEFFLWYIPDPWQESCFLREPAAKLGRRGQQVACLIAWATLQGFPWQLCPSFIFTVAFLLFHLGSTLSSPSSIAKRHWEALG